MTEGSETTYTLELTLEGTGERLDRALALAHPELSRVQWQRLIQEGQVTVNGRSTLKASQRINGGERVTAVVPHIVEEGLLPHNMPLEVCYEDADMLIVNKPAGVVTHPSLANEQDTLVNALLHHYPDLAEVGGEKRPGIVHRLDKHTSGLIVIARNERALFYLQEQFRRRTVQKKYLALVEGQLQPPAALIDAPIGRDPQNRKRMAVIPSNVHTLSRPAQTRYETIADYDDFTLVACRPLTGRTHQIRVHLAYIGFPIVCDHIYGRRKKSFSQLRRHFLHAAELTLKRPSDQTEITVTSALPLELQSILDELNRLTIDD